MVKIQEDEKRTVFKELLKDLARDPGQEKTSTKEACHTYQQKFEELYGWDGQDEFRHFYSDIFQLVSGFHEDPEQGDNEVLVSNLLNILENYQSEPNRPNVSFKLRKLYDHVSLDLARLNYNQRIVDQTNRHDVDLGQIHGMVNTIKQEYGKVRKEVSKFKEYTKEVEDTKRKIDDTKKEYIAILGIFSAVVLTFMGGIAFSTSVLENLHQSSAYRIILAICLIGLVLCNVLYLLFFCIQNLIGKQLSGWQKGTLIWCNAILLVILFIAAFCWYIGMVEKRDVRIQNENTNVYQVVETSIPTSQTPMVYE